MSGLTITITHAGRAALINAEHTGTAPVTITEVGVTATAFDAAPTSTSIPGELKRLSTLSGKSVAADTVHITIRDESTTSYALRGFGLYLGDGTLFAVYSQATPVMQKSAQSLLLLSVDIKLMQVAASSITFGNANFLNPPATTSMQGVVELATTAEAKAGTDATRAMTPATAKAVLDARLGQQAPSAFAKTALEKPDAAATRAHLGLKSAALKDEGAGHGLDADLLDGKHGSHYLAWGNQTGRPTTFPPSAHGHTIADVDGLQSALDNRITKIVTSPENISQRIDSGFYQQSNPGVGWPEGATGWWHLISSTHSSPNNYRALQFACSFNNDTVYVRRVGSSVNPTWNTLWHSGNFNPDSKAAANHTHPYLPLDGNASSASKLQSAVKINGTSFDGSANITTARWGVDRSIKIGNTTKTVNGSGNVIWSLTEIGAAKDTHTHPYLPLTGGTLTGNLTLDVQNTATIYLKSANGRNINLQSNITPNIGIYDNDNSMWLFRIDVNNKTHFAGTVKASGFEGNASTATKLQSAVQINGSNFDGSANIVTSTWGAQRKLKIGNTEKTVDGAGNVTWTPADIGYSASKTTNGWMKRPDGIIEQWGVFLMTTNTEITRSVTFPIAFPNQCLNVTVSDITPANGNSNNFKYLDMYAQVNQGSLGTTGFSVFIQAPGSSDLNWAGMYWRAIGH